MASSVALAVYQFAWTRAQHLNPEKDEVCTAVVLWIW